MGFFSKLFCRSAKKTTNSITDVVSETIKPVTTKTETSQKVAPKYVNPFESLGNGIARAKVYFGVETNAIPKITRLGASGIKKSYPLKDGGTLDIILHSQNGKSNMVIGTSGSTKYENCGNRVASLSVNRDIVEVQDHLGLPTQTLKVDKNMVFQTLSTQNGRTVDRNTRNISTKFRNISFRDFAI